MSKLTNLVKFFTTPTGIIHIRGVLQALDIPYTAKTEGSILLEINKQQKKEKLHETKEEEI